MKDSESHKEEASGVAETALGRGEFAAALRRLLRRFDRLDGCEGNALFATRLLAAQRKQTPSLPPAQALQALIREEPGHWGDAPKVAKLRRALELTYFEPLRSQQEAADALNMSWSTYRRHLSEAVTLLANRLWQAEALLAERAQGHANAFSGSHRPSRRRIRITLVAGLALIVVATGLFAWQYSHRASQSSASDLGIAVLPFENLSDDKVNAYFVDGIQGLILTKLAKIGALKVISRISTEQFGSHPGDLKTVGRQLGVAAVLEGGVQKVGKEVLINLQLINVKTGAHIWAQSYHRTLDNIFGVEGEVAQKVADALHARLTASEAKSVGTPPTRNAHAYNDYLRGQYFRNEAEKGAWSEYLPQAIAAYKKAIAQDSGFALAWANLAEARISAYYWGMERSKANLHAADRAARRALALNPKSADVQLAMGVVARFLYHDIAKADEHNRLAVDLHPNNPRALDYLAFNEALLGRLDAAVADLRRTIALDPMNDWPRFQLGLFLTIGGHYTEARGLLRKALAINPQNAQAYVLSSRVDILQNGNVGSAIQSINDMAPDTPVNASVAAQRIELLLYRRDFTAARTLAAEYTGRFKTGPAVVTMAMRQAEVEWLAGRMDAAHKLYRVVASVITRPGTDLGAEDHMALGLAYARLGRAAEAIKQDGVARAMNQRSHSVGYIEAKRIFNLAKIRLALGDKTGAIHVLADCLARNDCGLYLSPAKLRVAPTWDPVRNDPRFQALLKQYARYKPALTKIPAKSIAVLPFDNLNGSEDGRYLSDGLSRELIVVLSQVRDLEVVGHHSSFRFRDGKTDSKTIGEQLSVAYLLEGSVRRMGDNIRVGVELVKAADGRVFWSHRYDRTYRDIFVVEDEIAQGVANALKTKTSGGDNAAVAGFRPPGGSLDAYTSYLQGNFLLERATETGLRKAIAAYGTAIRLDPRYARAYAGLAVACIVLANNFLSPGRERERVRARARAAANAALTLNPNQAVTHLAHGLVLYSLDFNWAGAEAEFRRGLQLATDDSKAKIALSFSLATLGRTHQAARLAREAVASDPLFPAWRDSLATYLYSLGRLDEAEHVVRKAIVLQPDAPGPHVVMTIIQVLRGDAAAALRAAARTPAGNSRDYAIALAQQIGDDRSAAEAALRRLIDRGANDSAYRIAQIYALRKDADKAFEWLNRAWTNRDADVSELLYDSFLRRYRHDPRFAAFRRKAGLPESHALWSREAPGVASASPRKF